MDKGVEEFDDLNDKDVIFDRLSNDFDNYHRASLYATCYEINSEDDSIWDYVEDFNIFK